MFGSLSARVNSNGAEIPKKICSLLLALLLTISLMPNTAWADGTDTGAAEAVSPAEGAPAVEGGRSNSAASMPDEAESSGEPEFAAPEATENPSSGSASSEDAALNPTLDPPLSEQAFPSVDTSLVEQGSERAFDKKVYVYIQDVQDKGGMSKVTGALEVGAELWANVNDYVSDTSIAHEASWSYQWLSAPSQSSSSSSYAPIPGQTSQNLVITDELAQQLAGSYLAVKVTAEGADYYGPGYSGITANSVPGPVMKAGAVQLSGVELAKPSSAELGSTLEAKVFRGSSYSPTYVTEGVSYTWKYATTASYSTTWTTIEGAVGPTFAVDDEFYVGKYLSVSAHAGANTVDLPYANAFGPVKLAGAVDIYSGVLSKGDQTTYVFTVGDTATARAKEKGAVTDVFISDDKLNYQWQKSSDGKTFADILGQTSSGLTLDPTYLGAYVKCVVSAKIGSSTYTTKASSPIGAAGSVNVTSVKADKIGNLYPGDMVSAAAFSGSDNVTASDKLSWSWYCGDTAGSVAQKIEGANGSTLAIADDMVGKYVVARADGGFGEVGSSTLGPVVQKGSFKLYKVEVSGSPEIGKTVTALAYSDDSPYTPVSDNAVVSYQWQYADSKTTSDAAFKDIAGATGKTLAVPQDLLGTYLRVKAISLNSSVSTTKPYYGSTQPVDPVGPVKLAGAYELSSVKLSSSGQSMQAGNKITPTAQYKKGYSEYDVPADASVRYTWYVAADQDGVFEELTTGVDVRGRLTLDASLVGKWVKVSANALVNDASSSAYKVVGAGEYDLLRVTLNPSSGDIFTGDSISASPLAKNLTYTTSGDSVSEGVSFSWLVSDTKDGAYAALADAGSATLAIPAEAAGKYLKVVATSGLSSVEAIASNPVIGSDSLEAAARKLSKAGFKPSIAAGDDGNVNNLVEAKLAELGYAGIRVTTVSAEGSSGEPKAEGGVSNAADETNGSVTPFFIDPDEETSYVGYTTLRQVKLSFQLEKDGSTFDTTATFAPTILLPWNEDKVETLLENKAETLMVGYVAGDGADSVTANVTLPYKIAGRSWSEVSWKSSDASIVRVDGYGYSDYTGKVMRTAADRAVLLTATVGIITSGGPDTIIERAFAVTVKGDPDKVAAEKAALEKKVQANFTYDNLKLSETGTSVDKEAVTGDLSLPNPGTIGVDGKYYAVTYGASNDAVVINTYRGAVYRPLPGTSLAPVDLTVTVTDKTNPEITATKTLSIQITPLDQGDIDRELELMEAAKAGYFAALANGQASSTVTQNLHAFQKAYFDASGALAWTYDYASTSAAGNGIVPVDLEGYDSMGSEGWRLFKSSRPSVVSHENLLVKQPEYNTQVTLDSRLSSEKYARYAERYPDNANFQQLANQNVSASFTVVGMSGQVDPHVTATCSVIGVNKDGNQQTWAAASPYTLDNGATAADLSEAAFDAAGLVYESGVGQHGWDVTSITSPFDAGQMLEFDEDTGKYWRLFINGKAAGTGADGYTLQAGDSVIWFYSAYGEAAPTDELSVTCSVVGKNAQGARQTWASADTFALEAGSTAADASEELFGRVGLSADTGTGAYGWYLNSITSPYTGETLASREVSPDVWAYWQLFINGKLATVGAGGYVVQAGDEITWCYGSDGTLPGQVASTCKIIGKNANGNAQVWATDAHYVMVEGATAADLSEQVFVAKGIKAGYDPKGAYGWVLESVTSPFDKEVTLANENADPYRYWQLFVNGVSSDFGAGSVVLQPGDSVVWCYSSWGSTLPDPDEVVIVPDAPRPSYDSSWAGFGSGSAGGAVVERPTPTQSAEQAWAYDFKEDAQGNASVSEPLVVNGSIYLVVNGELRVIDAATGAMKKDKSGRELRANVGSTSAYCNRPVYSGGIVVVPSDNGSLTAFTADTLTCVWKTPPFDVGDSKLSYQSLSSLTVNGSYVYAAFTMVGAGGIGVRGTLVCVNLADGAVMWVQPNVDESEPTGYYWAGAASSGEDLVIGDESGVVKLVDGKTGNVLSSVSIGTSVRAGIVSVPQITRGAEVTFVAVSTDGVLHVITRNGDTLSKTGSAKFASKSTSTPASTGGNVFVCGLGADGYGTLSVIDLETLSVVQTVRGGKGEAQSSPLVSVQSDGTYAYFTCNGIPGGVYGYRLGDVEAYTLFTPGNGQQNYGLGSVIADEKGNLYYTNDSGHLFALKGQDGVRVTFESNGGSYVATSFVALGKAVARPSDPVKSGFTFVGWFSDAACTTAWDFTREIRENTTLYAKWAKVEAPGVNTSSDESGGQSGKDGSGHVLAVNAPLTKVADKSTNVEKKVAVDASSKSASKDAAEQTLGGVNPWAVGGIAVGVVGLVCATVYLVRMRRKPGTPGMTMEGK